MSVPARKTLDTSDAESTAGARTFDHLLVRVELANGTEGYGEVAPHPDWRHAGTRAACRAIVDELYAPAVVGTSVDRLHRTVERLERRGRGTPFALAGVDVALHDALARHRDVPLYDLLGGPVGGEAMLDLHYTVGIGEPNAVAEEASSAAERGFRDFKLKVGADAEREVAAVEAVREAVPDARVRVDANGAWTAERAIRRIRRLERAAGSLEFVEQPVAHDDHRGLARVREGIEAPVLADESCYDAADVAALATAEAVDMVNLKVANAGGIYGLSRAATVAETHGLACFAGSMLELGVGTAANAHVAVATPGVSYPTGILNGATFAPERLVREAERWLPSEPSFTLPDGPGLGVTVDRDAVSEYRVD